MRTLFTHTEVAGCLAFLADACGAIQAAPVVRFFAECLQYFLVRSSEHIEFHLGCCLPICLCSK